MLLRECECCPFTFGRRTTMAVFRCYLVILQFLSCHEQNPVLINSFYWKNIGLTNHILKMFTFLSSPMHKLNIHAHEFITVHETVKFHCVHKFLFSENSHKIQRSIGTWRSWRGNDCSNAPIFTDRRLAQCPHLTVTMLNVLFPGTLT